MKRFIVLGALFLALVLIVGACAPKAAPAPTPAPSPAPGQTASPAPAAPQGEWDKILAAARKEGTVTIYSTSAVQLRDASKAAMDKLGIKVETIGGSGGELANRITTEQRARANVADLMTGGYTTQVEVVQAGFGQPLAVDLPSFANKDVFKLDPFRFDPTKQAIVYGNGITPSIIVNSDLVREGEITSWNDLLDAKYRDRMVMTDPRSGTGPGTSGFFAWMTLGEEFWKKIAAQRPNLQVNPEIPTQQTVSGEKLLAIFPNFLRVTAAIRAGAPLRIVHFKEGTSYYVTGVALIKNAPHPNAALVFLDWMFSKEGQEAIGRTANLYTLRKDVKDSWIAVKELFPENFKALEPPNNIDIEGNAKAVEFSKKIFGAR
ncbi:MAG: extracellular solute-binding protein family 1 [Dehalococcoidia bacterium]|nr:extracellular solute-binding protein family 1 [Dehalococcoidia bacterium]